MVNKYISLAFVMLFALTTLVSAVAVGSPDNECQDKGFDYGIVKYSCGSTVADDEGTLADSYDVDVEWNNCTSVDWTADPAVDGVLVKAGTLYNVVDGGTSGTEFGINQTNPQGKNQTLGISHITFCADEPPVVPEFGLIAGLTTIAGALIALLIIRRN